MSRARAIAAAAVLSMLSVLSPALAGGAAAAPDESPTFIVTLRSGEPREVAADHARRHGAKIEFVYEHALRGYAARVSEGEIGALARDGRVARVERDGPVQAVGEQSNPTWGLDRIDDRSGLDESYTYASTGAGVTAYIIDTGIQTTHTDFSGRAAHGYDFIDRDADTTDCHGHGTHVAGTVGGESWGVAKDVALVGVRVLDCQGSGSWSQVIAGIDWVTGDARANNEPAVANMSLGGGASDSVDEAVRNSIASGVSYAIAAGNGNVLGVAQDACKYSPARVAEAMTIGATTSSDAKTSWSNYGDCVDWFAPGASITSAWIGATNTATKTISGTSMAAPHVAGAAALYLQGNTTATAQAVRDHLYAETTKGIVTSSKTANNHLLYTGSGTSAPTNAAPTASFTYACTDLACSFDGTAADADGDPLTYAWDFGDGDTSTDLDTAHTFAAAGTYTVTLTVTDDKAATGTTSQSVTVTATSTGGISLSASGYKVKGVHTVDLTWSGANSTSVDVYRGGQKIATTANDGAHTDHTGNKGGGSYAYKVCEAGTSTCSNEVTVTF